MSEIYTCSSYLGPFPSGGGASSAPPRSFRVFIYLFLFLNFFLKKITITVILAVVSQLALDWVEGGGRRFNNACGGA